MQKLITGLLLALVFASAGLTGCSSDRQATTEKSAVDQMTDEAARQLADQARIPMDKARAVSSQEEERLQGMADATKE